MADQLQREIEDILNKLDEFIPEQKTDDAAAQAARRRHRRGWGDGVAELRSRAFRWGT